MPGIGPNVAANVVSTAAAVGVVSSPVSSVGAIGTPLSSSAVAGAGMGIVPCAHEMVPDPTGIAEQKTRSTPSRSNARTAPVISTIASTAPTS